MLKLRSHSRTAGICWPTSGLQPSVRRLMLRVMVPLQGYTRYNPVEDSPDYPIARTLGLDVTVDTFVPEAFRDQLFAEHEKLNSKAAGLELPSPLKENMDKLSRAFMLTFVETQILTTAILLHSENVLCATASLLGDLSSLRTCQVLSALLDLPIADVRSALRPDGRLVSSGLLSVDHGDYTLKNKLDLISNDLPDRVSTQEFEPVNLLGGALVEAPRPELGQDDFSYMRERMELIVDYFRHAMESGKKGVNLLLYGAPGTGKTQLSRIVANALDARHYQVNHEDEEGDPISGRKRLRIARATQYLFRDQRTILTYDEADVFEPRHPFLPDSQQENKAYINSTLEENTVPTIWISNTANMDPAFLSRFSMVTEVLPMPRLHRREVIRNHCGKGLVSEEAIARIAECGALSPRSIEQTVRVIRSMSERCGIEERSAVMIDLLNETLQASGHSIIPPATADSLPSDYDPALINASINPISMARGLSSLPEWRLCFHGPPGTGKTAYAHWLAGQLDRPLRVVHTTELLSKYVGDTEKQIASIFRAARQEEAILLLEEGDSLMRDRRMALHNWEVTQVNELLMRMESYDGFLIVNTNYFNALDKAYSRRFTQKVEFFHLSVSQAWEMLAQLCRTLGLEGPSDEHWIDFAALDTLTPGDFPPLAQRHHFDPFRSVDSVIAALRKECELKVER